MKKRVKAAAHKSLMFLGFFYVSCSAVWHAEMMSEYQVKAIPENISVSIKFEVGDWDVKGVFKCRSYISNATNKQRSHLWKDPFIFILQ